MQDTIFHKIIEGQIPCEKILESDEFLSFYDINPKASIHALVIPKIYAKDFNDLDSKCLEAMHSFILEVVDVLGIKQSGYRLVTNIGSNGGQEVPYFHFHILGGNALSGSFA